MLDKVLVVDDSAPIHQSYKLTLKRYNCTLVSAFSREDGLRMVSEHPDVRLILADMNMPRSRMSCIDFVRSLKEQGRSANIPIVVVTTRGRNYSAEAFAYAEGFLMKPFTSNELHAEIDKIIDRPCSA